MTFLPIVDRELRVRSKLKSTYRFRISGAFVAIVIVLFILLATSFSNPGLMGKRMFMVLSWLIFPFCLFEGTRNTSDCLSEEKRGGTLGLLFLTDLKPYDLVIGKLVATSLNSFYGLLAALPPLAIPILLGGVTPGEFWRLTLVLVVTLFFSLTAGLFFSSISFSQRKAWTGTLGMIALCAIVLPLLEPIPLGIHLWIFHFSPTLAFGAVLETQYLANRAEYWLCLVCIFGLSWSFLGGAAFMLPRRWQESRGQVGANAPDWYENLMTRLTATGERERSSRLLAANPVLWLVGRNSRQYFYLWVLVGISGVSALALWTLTNGDSSIVQGILGAGLLLNYFIVGWVASQASGFFPEARASGAMELLLSTPLTVRTMLEGYVQALKKQFLWPVVALIILEVMILAGQAFLMAASGVQPFSAGGLIVAGGIMVLIFILDLNAVAYWGMWMGLSTRTASQAMSKTILYVLIFPMLSLACCWFAWPVVGIVKNLIFINYAQEQLRRHFRAYATERFTAGAEFSSWSPLPSARIRRRKPAYLPDIFPRQ